MSISPYRGRVVANKRWVYGFFYEDTPLVCFAEDNLDSLRQVYILVPGFADWGMPRDMEKHKVEPDSIGMYTGMTVNMGTAEKPKPIPVYTGMIVDVVDPGQGLRKNLTVSGPIGGSFVCGGDGFPAVPLGDVLEFQKIEDPA